MPILETVSEYEVFLFDADETLFDFSKAMEHSLKTAFSRLQIPFRDDYISQYQRVNLGFWKKLEKGEISKDEMKKQRMAAFFREAGIKEDSELMQVYYQEALNQSSFLLPDSLSVMKDLSKKKKCYLVTNGFAEAQRGRLAASGLAPYFRQVFISEELHTQKPNKDFFDAVFSNIGEQYRKKSIIIGDSLTSDIRGGNNAGIATCWFNPHGAKNTEGVSVTKEIKSLRELLSM